MGILGRWHGSEDTQRAKPPGHMPTRALNSCLRQCRNHRVAARSRTRRQLRIPAAQCARSPAARTAGGAEHRRLRLLKKSQNLCHADGYVTCRLVFGPSDREPAAGCGSTQGLRFTPSPILTCTESNASGVPACVSDTDVRSRLKQSAAIRVKSPPSLLPSSCKQSSSERIATCTQR